MEDRVIQVPDAEFDHRTDLVRFRRVSCVQRLPRPARLVNCLYLRIRQRQRLAGLCLGKTFFSITEYDRLQKVLDWGDRVVGANPAVRRAEQLMRSPRKGLKSHRLRKRINCSRIIRLLQAGRT